MANLQHDSEGFLNGENANLDKQTQLLQSISKDIADIKKSFTSNSAKNGQGKQSGKKVDSAGNSNKNRTTVNNSTAATSQSRHRSESINRNNAQSSNQQRQQNHAGRVQLGTLDNSSSSSSNQNSIQNRVTYEPTQQTSERQRETTETSGNIGANNNDANNRNSSNRTQSSVLQPTRNRDENGRFIGGNQGGRTQTVSEPRENATAGRDANGRFSSGESGGLGKGRGGEAGFISRLASGIGGVVGATKDEVTDEKIDPFIGAMKEVAEPLKKVGGAALKVGSVLFGGAKKAVDFLPKFKKKGAENTQSQSPASREVRTPPARIDETTTANPILRARDSRGRFISSQSVSQPSTRQTGSDFSQNNLSQRNAIEPSRNTIIGTNTSQSPSDSEQVSQSEPPVAGTSRRSFFGRGGNLGRKPKGEKLSLRGAIKEIITSRKEQTIYNKASLKLLKAIAGKETVSGGGDSGGGFLGGLMGGLIPMAIAGIGALVAGVVGVFTGIGGLLLTGVTGALGVIFSPIGLAIAAAGALAWGLFTDDGHKFFASIGEYISGGWDKATGFITENFGGVIDTATQFWADLSDSFAPITKVAGDLFDGLTTTWKGITDTISNIFDAFSTFLKDKFGIDIPAAVKTVTEPVVAAADAVVTQAKDAGNKIAEGAKDLREGAKEKATQAVEATKAVVNPAYEGVKKSVKDGTVLKDTATGVKNVAGKVGEYAESAVTGDRGNGKLAMKVLMDKGWTKEQAAGISANLAAESGFNTKATGDGGKAKGIAQWHPDRQKKFEEVNGKKLQDATFEEQVGFVDWELKNTEKKAGDKIKTAKTAAEAATLTEQKYERSKVGGAGGVHKGRVDDATMYANFSDESIAASSKLSSKGIEHAKIIASNAVQGVKNIAGKPAESSNTETALEKLSPISTAAASEEPANGGKVAPEITAQNKGGKDYFLGDSIAHGYRGKGEGDTVVGRNPAKILESMQANLAENPDFYKGKNVHLSTGMSNNTGDTKSIEAQMKLLKDSGANSSVYGVSNNFKGDTAHATTMNKTLSDLSAKYGANFTGGFEASKDTVHPKSYSKDASKNAEAQKSVDAGLKPEVLAQANAPKAKAESFSEANAPAISNYSKTGKIAKTESVAPIESPVIEPVEPSESESYKTYNADKKGMAGYMMKDNGEGGMFKTNLETREKTLATPEEISSYKTGTANPTELPIKEPPPEKPAGVTTFGEAGSTTIEQSSEIPEKTSQVFIDGGVKNAESVVNSSASNATAPPVNATTMDGDIGKIDARQAEIKAEREKLGQTVNVSPEQMEKDLAKSDELSAEMDKLNEQRNNISGSKEYQDSIKNKPASEVAISAVGTPATNETVAAPSIETPASTTVPPAKNSRIPKIELASRNKPKDDAVNVENEPPLIADIKSRMPALPEFATNAISGMTSGGIGSSLSGGMPSFMKDATSTISKSISMPSLPKMPSMPAIADAPAVKEPLGSNESRQNGAVSQPTADIGQNMSDSRLAHICSGGYSRG